MLPLTDQWTFDHRGSEIVFGRGQVESLGDRLDNRDLERAMIVCGSNVGANEALMGPIRSALGDRLVATYDETTPAKSAETIFEGIEAMAEYDPDVLIGVGGGSSLDVARQMSVFAESDRSLAAYREDARAGEFSPPEPADPTDVVVVPTTFAGADLSSGGSFELITAEDAPDDQPFVGKGRVWPTIMLYDPESFETTPRGALAGSVMNGFNKGIETLYAAGATPVSDATSIHGLRLLTESLPELDDTTPSAMDRAVAGIVLVQLYRKINVIHAFGHGFSRRYPVQQGRVHAILAPYVLEYLLESLELRRSLLAAGLGLDPDRDDLAEAIVDRVTAVRDAFELPTRLRDLDPVDPDDFPAIAAFILDDHLMPAAPEGLDPTPAEVEAVLEAAW